MLNKNKIVEELTGNIKADYEHAISWKKNSKQLFEDSFNDEDLFKKAVLWCGVNGNVTRTVKTEKRSDFYDYVWENRFSIRDGNFDLTQVKDFGVRPISWMSKMCHIINPRKYPIIYDEKVRNNLGFKDIKAFMAKMDEIKHDFPNKSDDFYYELDAAIWASNTRIKDTTILS